MSTPQPLTPIEIEKHYAMREFSLTSDEYDALVEAGCRYKAHGLFNRNSWVRQVKVHGGHAWSPAGQEYVDTLIMKIRMEKK